jgi:drug/metabolite transporter (DMT)-like permease
MLRTKRVFRFYNLLLLFSAFLVYSSESVFIKWASLEEPLSLWFNIYYGIAICVLGLYAVLWQLVLKRMPLSLAYMCKSLTLIIILLIAHMLFGESISTYNIVGGFLIICGILMLVGE